MKKKCRFIGFNEAVFDKGRVLENGARNKTLLVGTVYRGGDLLEGIVSTQIEIDGDDATEKIIQLVKQSKFGSQLKCILLGSIAMAGLNLVDLPRVYQETQIPVMAVIRRKPVIGKVQELLKKLKMEHKIPIVDRAGPFLEDYGIYFQLCGLSRDDAIQILDITMIEADYPEPLRISKMIANGIVRGAS